MIKLMRNSVCFSLSKFGWIRDEGAYLHGNEISVKIMSNIDVERCILSFAWVLLLFGKEKLSKL